MHVYFVILAYVKQKGLNKKQMIPTDILNILADWTLLREAILICITDLLQSKNNIKQASS